jgi:hypothetical protein
MSFDSDLRNTAAGLAGAILDPLAFGSSLVFKHRDGTQLTLNGRPGQESKDITTMLACRAEVTDREFWIPYQPLVIGIQGPSGPQGFPYPNTTGPSEFDKIIFNGLTWYIQGYKADSVEALYHIRTRRWQVTKIGID